MSTAVEHELTREGLRDLARGLVATEARWAVDYYYAVQDFRIQASGQARAIAQEADQGVDLLSQHLAREFHGLENEIKGALEHYAKASRPGRWALSITGVGPVIAAGLLAHIDIGRAPTVGHIWRFAGLDPSVKWHGSANAREIVKAAKDAESDDWSALLWICRAFNTKPTTLLDIEPISIDVAREFYEKRGGPPGAAVEFHSDNLLLRLEDAAAAYGELYETKIVWDTVSKKLAKRPWNAKLKVLCWKIGDSFVKQKGRESDIYGKVYEQRKALELERNDGGQFADQAAQALDERNIRDKDLKATYEAGRLPAGRLDLRARRYAVKLFLAHLHHVMYEDRFGEAPPKPYVIEHGGHAHFIAPPQWPCD